MYSNDFMMEQLSCICRDYFDEWKVLSSDDFVSYGKAYGIIGKIGKDEISYSFNETLFENWFCSFDIVRENIEDLILSA